METRSLLLSLAVASCLAAAGAASAEPAAPDTSEWKCSKCPFPGKSYESTVTVGGGYLSESSAKFGDYTGLTDKGGYVVADAEGGYTSDSGYGISYELTDLGLDSRAISIEGGKQGAYQFGLSYDRIPVSIWDTTETPFKGAGSKDLTLPANWVFGGSTSGMTSLPDDLHNVDVGYDHDRYGLNGKYFLGQDVVLAVDYKRDERSGFRSQFGAIGGTSTQLLKPLDDATDRVTATVRYQTSRWFAEVGYYGSFYNTKAASLDWQNPFKPGVPGATEGRMALAPDNSYNEFAISAGMFGLPGNTTVALSAATGKGTQDVSFLPYTVNPTIATQPLPMSNLRGDVDVTRADLTVTSRPMNPLRLRGSVTYDESKDGSRQAAFGSIVYTDAFPTYGAVTNPAYGFERFRLFGSADYDVYKDLNVGLGGEYKELKRTGTEQEVSKERLTDGWARAEYRPTGYLGIVVRGGALERKPSGSYDVSVAQADGQNPLMRKYNMAYLYQSYGNLVANLALGTLPLTVSASVFYADNGYDQSQIGLTSGIDRRYGVDVNWAINEKMSAYVNGGQDKIDTKQSGSSAFASPDWRGVVDDEFMTVGVGFTTRISDRASLNLDYTYATGDSRTTIRGVAAGNFPKVTSDLNSFKADFTYDLSERLDVVLTWWHERFDSNDWALDGIGPATLPNVLALGADPYNYSVDYVTASLRYSFAPGAAKKTEE
ncbi:MAG: MtrB/PioB family decaheme-associated outer membrane protein [Gammaproteobacteria bacterium]|nr:MtrB/PioB family decaheme-associated outer membrane protein [Gammaproteobacteria bacterium]